MTAPDARRPDPSEAPPYFAGYLATVPDRPLLETLHEAGAALAAWIAQRTAPQLAERSAPGKWTVGEAMQLAAAHGWPEAARPWLGALRVEVGRGPSGEAVAERRVIEIADVQAAPTLVEWQAVATELGFHAVTAVPLLTHEGIHGALTVYFPDAGTIPVRTRALLRAGADLMAAMVERGALAERLRRAEAAVAGMDPL